MRYHSNINMVDVKLCVKHNHLKYVRCLRWINILHSYLLRDKTIIQLGMKRDTICNIYFMKCHMYWTNNMSNINTAYANDILQIPIYSNIGVMYWIIFYYFIWAMRNTCYFIMTYSFSISILIYKYPQILIITQNISNLIC